MGATHEAARKRRETIIAMGPDLPTRAEVADAVGVDKKITDQDILILMRQDKIRSVKPVRDKPISDKTRDAIRAAYGNGAYMEDICAKFKLSPHRVRNACRNVHRPEVSKIKLVQAMPGHTTREDGCISSTYAATAERAKDFQRDYRAAANRATAAFRARARE